MNNHHNTQELGIGWLYVVTHANAQGLVKIGITDRPERRMDELGNPTVLARVPVRHPRRYEQRLHQIHQAKRVPQTEWFSLDEEELADVFQSLRKWSQPFLNLIVLPAIPDEPEPEAEQKPEPKQQVPDRIGQTLKPSQWNSCGKDESPVGQINELRRKLGIETWRAEMLIEHGLENP